MITRELLSLLDPIKAQVLYIYELTEVIIVHKNKNLVFTAFQVVALSLEGFNDS